MSMDSTYQAWHKQADDLHYRVQDAFDEPEHPASQLLKRQLRDLINDYSLQRSPHDIEDRIKNIMHTIEPARHGQQSFMSVQDAVTYHDTFERMRREVRQHPHYS